MDRGGKKPRLVDFPIEISQSFTVNERIVVELAETATDGFGTSS
jgi:hypothetical protein